MKHHKPARACSFLLAVLALLAFVPSTTAAPAGHSAKATYQLTIKNLARNQAFSPPLVVVHGPSYRLFRVGTFASDGMRLIAEMGDLRTAIRSANASSGVALVRATSSIIGPGRSLTVQFNAPAGSLVSLATMLEQTNDGFTAVDAARLPVSGVRTIGLSAYDAGTEANNELRTHVPGAPFAGFRRAPTHKPIAVHGGITGVGHLKASTWNWPAQVALLTIERVR
jgi:hypothetical protein